MLERGRGEADAGDLLAGPDAALPAREGFAVFFRWDVCEKLGGFAGGANGVSHPTRDGGDGADFGEIAKHRVAAEDFVGTEAGEDDFETARGDLVADDVGVDGIDGGEVHRGDGALDEGEFLFVREVDMVVVRAVEVRHLLGELAFVESFFGEAHGEGREASAAEALRGEGGEDGGIDATAEEAGHGHIGEQMGIDGILEETADGFGGGFRGGEGSVAVRGGVCGPEANGFGKLAGGADAGVAAGWKFPDVFKNQTPMSAGAPVEKIGDSLAGECAAGEVEERADLRGEGEAAGFRAGEVEGFDAEAVADENDFAAAGFVDGGGEHPAKAGEDGGAPGAVAAEEGFGVAVAAEGGAEGFEFAAEGEVVVDFAV